MFSDPKKVIDQCGIQAGQEIADLGSAVGSYSMAISRELMGTGRVYAIDIQKDLLTKLKEEAVRSGCHNIEVIWGNLEKIGGTRLKDYSVDMAFLANVMFQLEDKVSTVKEVKRILRPGGRVVVVDWTDSFGGIGPQPAHLFPKAVAEQMFIQNGFHMEKSIEAGAHHYGFIFKKL